jgi:hypothetical protein
MHRLILAMVLTVSAGAAVGSGSTGLADLRAVTPKISCGDVRNVDLTNVTIASATVVSAGTPTPFCEVRGTIAPADTIVVRLPVNGWTQRYVQTGCGGLCGSSTIDYGQSAGCPRIWW